jgi:predicted  nucleic acid-binding Zn-ribbon protein
VKPTHLTIACLTLAALAVGCNPSSEPSATESRPATARQLDPVQQQTNVVTQVNHYAYAQRAEFVATRQTQLAEINRELDQLEAKIENADAAAKAEARPRLEALREQVAQLNTHLGDARNATESTWDNVKAGFEQGYSELKDGFNQARQWVGEKIAP